MNRSIRGALPAHAHTAKASKTNEGGFVHGLIAGGLCSIAATVLSLLLCALIAYNSSDPDALFAPLGIGCLVLACLAGGLGIGLRCHTAILPCATLCSCAFIGLGLLAGMFLGADTRQALSLGLGLGASLCLRAGEVALFCASAALTARVKGKLQEIPRRHR